MILTFQQKHERCKHCSGEENAQKIVHLDIIGLVDDAFGRLWWRRDGRAG